MLAWIRFHSIDWVLRHGVDWVAVGSVFIGISVVIASLTILMQGRTANRSHRIENTWRLMEYWRSPQMLQTRAKAVRALNNPRTDENDADLTAVLNFFDNVGYFLYRRWIDLQSVDLLLADWVVPYWIATEHIVQETRRVNKTGRSLVQFERLYRSLDRYASRMILPGLSRIGWWKAGKSPYAQLVPVSALALLQSELSLIPARSFLAGLRSRWRG